MVGVESSKAERFKIDKDFLDASIIRPYKYFGGAFPEFEDNWNQWSQSILMKNNLICTNWEAVPITDLLDMDHRIMGKKNIMKTALALYLNKPTCSHIVWSENKPNNTIMKITDSYRCLKKKQGSYWLVNGADHNNECLVSWAYVKGTGKKVVGLTQHLRTDFNKENVCL